MEKFLVPLQPPNEEVHPLRRVSWKRSCVELNGRFEPNYRHEMMDLLSRSYTEIRAFPHLYEVDGRPCQTHLYRVVNEANGDRHLPFRKLGVSAVDFDKKGIYMVSVTRSGCLTVHDFEALYCKAHGRNRCMEDKSKHLLHLSLNQQLDAVRWNPLDQDEVVCASVKSNKLLIFNVGYISSEPVEELRTRNTATVHGFSTNKGLSEVAFTSNDSKWVLASDTLGGINVWDRRVKTLPCLEFISSPSETLNSVQVDAGNQLIYGAGERGFMYAWDIRGGRASATFQSHQEICHPPVSSVKLATLLDKIESLKAQAYITSRPIHSIDFNPSCPYQLAFHLDNGWSGVLDTNSLQVTHIHCPPSAWLDESLVPRDQLYIRKPSWLSTCSIYLVGSPAACGIHLLDFHPSTSSPSHVDYKDETQENAKKNKRINRNRSITASEGVISCAAHPLYHAIIAGTKQSSLVVISQKRESRSGEE